MRLNDVQTRWQAGVFRREQSGKGKGERGKKGQGLFNHRDTENTEITEKE
jgi:hypothetical protein